MDSVLNRSIPETYDNGLENQSIWHWHLGSIQRAGELVSMLFRRFRISFREANRGSLILKFETMDDFDVNLLKPEDVKKQVLEMIKTLCPEYQDLLKEPVHLTIYLKPSSSKDRAEVYFYLENSKEKDDCSCVKKLGRRDKQIIVEEINEATLTKWIFDRMQLNEDIKTKMEDLSSSEDMSRKKKTKKLLILVESLENAYELLEKYCEEHEPFVYDKVFKKQEQMMAEEKAGGAQQNKSSAEKKEGLQKLSCTWMDFTV